MNFTASQIAELVSGTVEGNINTKVNRLSKIEEGTKGSLSFLANPKYTPFLYTTDASITLVSDSFVPEKEFKTTLIRVSDPYEAFSKLLEHYNQIQKQHSSEIAQTAIISEAATIAKTVFIGDYSQIGAKTSLKDHVVIHPQVYIGNNVSIGENAILDKAIISDSIIGPNSYLDSAILTQSVVGNDAALSGLSLSLNLGDSTEIALK